MQQLTTGNRSDISTEVTLWIEEIRDQLDQLTQQEYELTRQRREQEETLRWLQGLLADSKQKN